MVTDSQADDTTAFLRAARSGNLERVVEFLDTDLDINTANSNGLNALHLASKDGHVEIVTELLKRGAKVDAATRKGNTALHIASLAGQCEIVNILIQYGAAVNIQSQNGFTPLYMAAQENHDQVVKLLLGNGANQSLATEDGFTPLAVAMQQGHDKVVSVLLENDSKGKVRLPALHIAAKKDDCKAADLLLQNDHKPDVTSKSGFTPLHIAAHYGNEEIARLLIKRGADVNYLAKHNISPLHVAAKWGKNNMVKILLENSAQIDAKTKDGLTPLHCAARSGHEQVVSTLLENSAPISARTKNGLAPLHMASQGDHVDAARVLLYHRAPVDEVTIDYLTSLHVAAHCGHVRVAKLLLDRKADPNARALNGFTPLHIACKKNRIKVVELLLKHGASIESTTESGLTPLHVASFMGCMNIVIFLLQHEANPDVPTVRGETPLHLAARANQTDIIRILLRNGAKVDARAREQQTPLHIASRLGNIDIVMLLLQHGAAVDTATKDMYTALHIAAKEGQEEVAAILVENNASLKAATKNGFTPLHIAAKYGNMNVANILLQKKSKLDVQGKNDITPLHLACHYDHPNVATLLLEKGASPHLASQNGHTPLHIAARKNQMDIASTLLESGAKANAESKAGFTPLHLSAQKGHYDMTNLLIEHGANPNHKAKNGLTALHLCAQEDFIRVASILVKNGVDVESQTETGYRPIHVAAHFGNLSMIRFLLKHNATIDVRTNQNYTPLHQAAQQGHAHIVTALLEGNASHKARTNDGLTALNIAQKLGYISVMEVLKGLPYDSATPDNKNWEEKYKVIAPESLQETSFMSDSEDEGGSDALISEQPYRYLTVDLMKSLRDDSLPIDVTRDDPVHRQVSKEEKQEFTQSNNYCLAENFDNDGLNLGKLHFRSFLISFLVDARGGAMKGCRHSGVRIIIPPRRATMPIRVTCKLVKATKVANPPPLMEGEALATRIIEMGPVGARFLGPVLIDIPHFASVRGKEREIIILRSENGETWKEHDNSADNDDTLLNTPYDPQMSVAHSARITRIITTDFPQYFAIVTRIKQEVHVIGAEGCILLSSVANHVQAVFPPGALTKKIKVGLQAHVIPAELTAKLLGNCVAVSPVITIEPRRRKFHKPITLTIPVPQAANKGMINQYGGETPTLRLLCSIAGGTNESQWEDVTGSTPLTFMNDKVSFTTTVSARFWLMDCRNIGAVPKMATELYEASLHVPYITNFIIYSKRMDVLEATLRILCMTDGKEGMHTLERQEEFTEIVKSRDVEALDGKELYIEFSGNLVPVTKSGMQLKFTFRAFRQNRLSFHVKVKDPLLDPVARMLFMREPKVAKGEPPQQPICVLNIVLPETIVKHDLQKRLKGYEDSNIINQKLDYYKSKYKVEQMEKTDKPKETSSPTEKKFITDTLQKEQTDAAFHESFAQKAACPLESVDASYPNKVGAGQSEPDLSPDLERQTYSEKRKFWEDISRKRENYQRSESEISRTSQLTINESDSESCLPNVVSEEGDGTTEGISDVIRSETIEDINVPDISECSVAEKAHYFEEQIQKEMAKGTPRLHQQDSSKSEKDKSLSKDQKSHAEKSTMEMTKEKIDIQEKHVAESREIEKILKAATEGDKWMKEPWKDKNKKDDDKEAREEVKKITAEPMMEICKELLNKERELAEETQVRRAPVGKEIAAQKKPDISTDIAEKEQPETSLSKEKLVGKQITTKETTITYKMEKDETLMPEQIHKSMQIKGANGKSVTRTDIRTELFPLDDKKEIEQFLEEERRIIEEEAERKMMADFNLDRERKSSVEIKQMKKEFESRIPISTAMADKDKSQKEGKGKILPEKPEEKPVKSSLTTEKEKDIASPSSKKKEFESRIPKRIMEGAKEKEGTKKDLPGRKEGETITVTERKSSEEVTSRHEERTKSKTHTFSKTFTDAQDAFRMFEDISAMKDKDFDTVTSKVDTKATSKVEKKEVFSSKISSGADKFITHEEKEKVERKKSSESKLTKESPAETTEEKKSKSEEVDKTAVQKMSMNVTKGKEVIDASASETRAKSEKEELFKLLEDREGTATKKSGTSRDRKSDVDVAIRIKKDDAKKVEDIKEMPKTAKGIDLGKVEMVAQGQSYRESLESFNVEQFVPSQKDKMDLTEKVKKDGQLPSKEAPISLEKKEQLIAKEIEARNLAEGLIQSIESEIEKRSLTSGLKPQMLSKEYLDQLISESSDTDHEKLADDLTKQFESIMQKDEQLMDYPGTTLTKTSIQEEMFEKGYTRDSISEDITKDEESSPHDREESLQSSSQAKLQDRDITLSPSSISEQIDLEETIDVDTGELEDISKSSPRSEKLRSDRSSSHIEPLQKDIYSDSLSKDKIVSEISGARVLEILEPGIDSRQDSFDVPSLELDEHKVSEQTSRDVASLHESVAVDSLEKIGREKDTTVSSSTVSEDVNVEYPPIHERALSMTAVPTREYDAGDRRRADSFEIESPPLVSPRVRNVRDLEIKPVDWMIGDEKIEISEMLQPSQVFSQELEEYESSLQRTRTSSQDESVDLEQESMTKSSEEISVIESVKESMASDKVGTTTTAKMTKFTVTPVTEPDFESELIENKLDISCQELVDTLQREYDAKTPTDEYAASIRQSISREDFDWETSITEAVTEMIPMKEEEVKDLATEMSEIKAQEMGKETFQRDISADKVSAMKEEKADFKVKELEVTKEGITETKEIKKESTKEESELPKCARVDDVLKEWTETYLVKIKPPSEEYRRHMEKTTEKHDKSSKSTTAPSDTCAFKIKKDDHQNVDLSARYAITVLDQVVKKEIAEVKESLEAAKQDLIEELSENSQTVIQIKDSPSEFQFKLQPESIPNDLPFLYRPPSIEHVPAEAKPETEAEVTTHGESSIVKTQKFDQAKQEDTDDKLSVQVTATIEDRPADTIKAPEIGIEKHEEEEPIITVDDDEDEGRPSPLPISRSSDVGSDMDNRDDSYSLALPHPAPRRRHKLAKISKKIKSSESEADVSSSGESSNYQSCDYEVGSGSRPSSSDVEAMQSAAGGVQSGTASEYETAMMSVEHEGSKTLPTSQEYQTAASTLSSHESMKSLNSLSSGHLGSIDSTSELSETLVPSEEADVDADEIDENLESALDAEHELAEASDSSGSEEIPMDEAIDKLDKIDSHIPCRMKRSSEMIFQQIIDDSVGKETESVGKVLEEDRGRVADSATSAFMDAPGVLQSADIMTSRVSEGGVQSVCTQVISTRVTRPSDSEELEEEKEDLEAQGDTEKDVDTMDVETAGGLEQILDQDMPEDDGLEPMRITSVHSMLQQASTSLSSASGMSFDTVVEKDIEKDRSERHSPDSDSFELVDKPDIIDDFVVIEEVGREAEEFDAEGKSIRISSVPQTTSKQYDRDLENLIAEKKEDTQVSTSQTSKNNDLFDFETEESPPQVSNEDQSQSYSDEEQYENKKWIEMQFHADARVYDIEYDRGPLEDIKEEEVTDFEAGSSRLGSLGSHKESIGSVGSMRGSLGSTPDYDVLGKKYFTKPTDHDSASLTSLQEFEHLESTVAAENSRRVCGSQDSSSNNGSLPRRYVTSRSGHGDDVSLSSLKDFEGLEKACREAHLMELRAREEEELLEHESPENKYKLENLPRSRTETSAAGSFNPSTSGSDDYEKRIKEIDEIIRIAQSNVEKSERQDDTTEDISQIEATDAEKVIAQPIPETLPEEVEELDEARAAQKESNIMETSTDSLELEDAEKKYHQLCRSSDSLEMKTTLDFPSLSSDSLNNIKDAKETAEQYGGNARRISSDSLEMPLLEQQDAGASERSTGSNGRHAEEETDRSVGRTSSTGTRSDKMKTSPSSGT
ncbi:PREDICTED: ankyrin-2-like isoform X2 [Vollenhovia emeryi]|uniref:ankyrin-2-like isoform X2 n=1 Tax=Vollenhovia emeryi TaxID=411798 RepID=UPI0005F36A85|nr:PREDICTED: ankyrin-2-like isoform X2 [Vollenhovia emeryi]